ncbi:hypothetical protein D915_002623 [Fasciola hepatica]|uniref:Uncharacterized protein n=1 Tax=Fasciola hepatica TaxID=6192 RepID=A0A2H1CMR5_FASHE|nr:hypothetical protein D915_002623 [Fasciola hepatica]
MALQRAALLGALTLLVTTLESKVILEEGQMCFGLAFSTVKECLEVPMKNTSCDKREKLKDLLQNRKQLEEEELKELVTLCLCCGHCKRDLKQCVIRQMGLGLLFCTNVRHYLEKFSKLRE